MITDRIILGEAGQPSEGSTPVPWWSFTKTVLAAATLRLVADGRLDLADRVAGQPYTLRHLLQHTAGVRDYGPLRTYHAAVAAGETPWSRGKLLERVKADELGFAPGTSWAYSNVGYLLVRQAIERATDLELNEALRVLLFGPLGIDGAFVATSAADLAGTAWGNAGGYDPGWVYHGLVVGSPFVAASFLHRMLFDELLPPHLKTELLTPARVGGPFPGRPFVAPSYGLGVMMDPANALGLVVGHTGQGPGSTSAVYAFPDLPAPRTLAAFMPDDSEAAQGLLETHLFTLAASADGRRPSS
jgi:D-alanyl-D-alanine carboxypeptidase